MTTEQFKTLCAMTAEQFNALYGKDIIAAADQALMNINMDLIRNFLREGQEHGTTVEALYYAFRAILDGEATTIDKALETGANEWYK